MYLIAKFFVLNTKSSITLSALIPSPSLNIERREFKFLYVWLEVFVVLPLEGESFR
jgi:hypothetical protein